MAQLLLYIDDMGRTVGQQQMRLQRASGQVSTQRSAQRAVSSRQSKIVKKTLSSRIASFLGMSSAPATRRPVSTRDAYQAGSPSHVAAPVRLSQLAQGGRANNRPSDVQLSHFLNNVIKA